jgi:hypothetical protein
LARLGPHSLPFSRLCACLGNRLLAQRPFPQRHGDHVRDEHDDQQGGDAERCTVAALRGFTQKCGSSRGGSVAETVAKGAGYLWEGLGAVDFLNHPHPACLQDFPACGERAVRSFIAEAEAKSADNATLWCAPSWRS